LSPFAPAGGLKTTMSPTSALPISRIVKRSPIAIVGAMLSDGAR
jgi:hypothetical protein